MAPRTDAALLRTVARLHAQAQRTTLACCGGPSATQCQLLTEVDRAGEVSVSALAKTLGLELSWTGRAVDRLVAEGLLTKQASAQDRRTQVVRATEQGRERTVALNRTLDDHANRILARVPQGEREAVSRALKWVTRALEAEGRAEVCRPARPEDLRAIQSLLEQSSLPLEGVAEHLGTFLVLEREGRVVAALGMEVYGQAGLLRSAVVEAPSRGLGLGTRLVEEILVLAQERGLKTLVLLTETARPFAEGLGFRLVDRSAVPEAVKASAEFQGACPVSAEVLMRDLG